MCGIRVDLDPTEKGDNAFRVTPDKFDPFSKGSMCPKAPMLGPLHSDPERLREPHMREGTSWREISWDEAYSTIAERLKAIRRQHGADSIATYLGNPIVHNLGMLLFVRSLTDAIGSRNVYSATSMDQLPHHFAAHFMFGHEFRIPVPDIDRTEHMIIMGANPIASNGSIMTSAGVTDRLRAIRDRGGRFIVIDPRRTETANVASDHHFITPGTDIYFLLAFLHVLDRDGLVNVGHLAPFLNGFDALMPLIKPFAPNKVAAITGISAETIEALATEFAGKERAVLYGRMGLSTQMNGGLCNWLINAINIATGNFDTPGGMMFPTPAIELARGKQQPTSVGRWRSRVRGLPEFYGELPVSGMTEELLTEGEGKVRAFLTICGNPVLSTPGGGRLDRALENIDFMVSIDNYINETTRHADIILPTPSGLEVDHFDLIFNTISVSNNVKFSEALMPVEDERPFDWQVLKELIYRLSEKKPDMYVRLATPRRIVNWGLMLGAYGRLSHPKRWFSGLTLKTVIQSKHGINLGPLQPRVPSGLLTADRKIHVTPDVFQDGLAKLTASFPSVQTKAPADSQEFALIGRRNVNTNNSWMHQYRKLSRSKLVRCTAMISVGDAERLGISDGADILVSGGNGEIRLPAEVTDSIKPGVVCIPHGFGHGRTGTHVSVADEKPGVSVNDITNHLAIDPVTGNAAFSGQFVRVTPLTAPRASIEVSGKPLTIIFGTRTGNSEYLACEAGRQAEQHGMVADVRAMDEITLDEVAALERLVVVCSTYGEGDMPDNASDLWAEATAAEANKLHGLHYSVLSLGDTSYETFCQAGRDWDRRLAELGATSAAERADLDVDYTEAFEEWSQIALPAIALKGDQTNTITVTRSQDLDAQQGLRRDTPLIAKLARTRALTTQGSSREVHHFAIAHPEIAGLYTPGDILNVIPRNNPQLVESLLDVLQSDGDLPTDQDGETLRDRLTRALDIRTPSKALIDHALTQASDSAISGLLDTAISETLTTWLYGKDVIDLLTLLPNPAADRDRILKMLRPLTPRSYSISSSPNRHDKEAHLCVAVIRYESGERSYGGTGSTFLADMLSPGDELECYVVQNSGFKLPADGDRPVIMIGPGTGIAPFRAFLEQHEVDARTGETWLFFGARNRATDYLYRDEIEDFHARGVLTKLDLAFSRDQKEKIYVQQRMRENGAELFAWLEAGANIYVCGDAERMAKDVEAALREIVLQHGEMTPDEAHAYIERLKHDKRYLRDVY